MNIEDRVNQLEQQNRTMKIALATIAIAAGAALATVILPSPRKALAADVRQTQEIIEARGFRLLDENGKVRASFTMTDNDPMLVLEDRNGRPRVGLTIVDNQPLLVLNGEDSMTNAKLTVSNKEPWRGPLLLLKYNSGKKPYCWPSLELRATSKGPRLSMYNDEVVAESEVAKDGPSIKFYDEKRDVTWSAP